MSLCVKKTILNQSYDLQQGVALVTVLFFMQILAMLALFTLQLCVYAKKLNYNHQAQVEIFQKAEQRLHEIEEKVISFIPTCVIPVTTPHDLSSKPILYWQSTLACHSADSQYPYHYVIELLDSDDCVMIHHRKINYIRITLLMLDNKKKSREMLQSTLIRLDNAEAKCKEASHDMSVGRQMWREIKM